MKFKRASGPWSENIPAKAVIKTLDLREYRGPYASATIRDERRTLARVACRQAFLEAVMYDNAHYLVINCGPREPRDAALFTSATRALEFWGYFLLESDSTQYEEHLVVKVNEPYLKRLHSTFNANKRRGARRTRNPRTSAT